MRLSDGCITGSRRAPCGCRLSTRRPGFEVTTDGIGVVGHAGAALLRELADRLGLTGALGWRVPGRRRRHLDAAVLRDLAVMLADGGDCLSDLAALRDQPELFGPVASTPTAWRVLERLAQDPDGLARLRAARAHARGRAWVAGGDPEMELLVIDADATLVLAHSDAKEGAAGHLQGHRSGSPRCWRIWTAARHPGSRWPASCGPATPPRALPMTWSSWSTWPWPSSPGPQLTSRSWSAATAPGPAPGWPGTCATRVWGSRWGCRSTPMSARRSGPNPSAPGSQQSTPTASPAPALRCVELTGWVDLHTWPPGTRAVCRREDAHPGAQLRFSDLDGHRFQVFFTDQPDDDLAGLELRHRQRARVEDRIRAAKATGLSNLPFDRWRRNSIWLELVLAAQDLTCWTQALLLDGDLAVAEPKTLRYRLLHVAARVVRHARRVILRLQRSWPWAIALARAFTRLRALPLRC